jgi:hypothetical protein
MNSSGDIQGYPRPLSKREREWLEWILPDNRPGYRLYRQQLAGLVVIGEGRRGAGEIILGSPDDRPDFSAPLAPVFAYGMIETSFGGISITLREESAGQVSVEMVSHRSEHIPEEFEQGRRWTYSAWLPGTPCPQCGGRPREVLMRGDKTDEPAFDMAVCVNDKRIWIYERSSGINRLIPVTNYYNELMLRKNIRDPKIALSSANFFSSLAAYTDDDLTAAFTSYNRQKTKVRVEGNLKPADKPKSVSFISRLLRKS